MYKPIRSSRLYEQVVKRIEDQIVGGELKEGDQLPSERELAMQFGVSRTAIREAMKALLEKGLVEVRHGRGVFVSASNSRAVRDTISRMIRGIGLEGYIYLMEVRELIEPGIAMLAAQRATEENIRTLEETADVLDEVLDDPERFVEADLDFHLALAEASGNPIVPMLTDSIIELLRGLRAHYSDEEGAQQAQKHHRQILNAVAAHDAAAAREAMQAHLRHIREVLEAVNALDRSGQIHPLRLDSAAED